MSMIQMLDFYFCFLCKSTLTTIAQWERRQGPLQVWRTLLQCCNARRRKPTSNTMKLIRPYFATCWPLIGQNSPQFTRISLFLVPSCSCTFCPDFYRHFNHELISEYILREPTFLRRSRVSINQYKLHTNEKRARFLFFFPLLSFVCKCLIKKEIDLWSFHDSFLGVFALIGCSPRASLTFQDLFPILVHL